MLEAQDLPEPGARALPRRVRQERQHLEKHGERANQTLFDSSIFEYLRYFWTLYGVYKILFDTVWSVEGAVNSQTVNSQNSHAFCTC